MTREEIQLGEWYAYVNAERFLFRAEKFGDGCVFGKLDLGSTIRNWIATFDNLHPLTDEEKQRVDGTATPEVKPFTLLKFRDLWIVVEGSEYDHSRPENRDYFYHSHQCAENLLRKTVAVYDAQSNDPHAVLRLVACVKATGEELEWASSLAELFALFKTDGQPAPSTWPEEDGGLMPWLAEEIRERDKEPKS